MNRQHLYFEAGVHWGLEHRPFFSQNHDKLSRQITKIKILEAVLGDKLIEFAKKITAELDITYSEVLEALKTIGGESEETMERILLITSVKKLPIEFVYKMVKRGEMT